MYKSQRSAGALHAAGEALARCAAHPALTPGQAAALDPTDRTDAIAALGDPSLNDVGEVAFILEPDFGNQILVTGADPGADRVIGVGDALFGRIIVGLLFGREGLNDAGQLAFTAFFDDGSSAVVLATPGAVVPEPGTLLLVAGALPVLVGVARRRAGR